MAKKIFLSIASYADKMLTRTVLDALLNAKYPQDIVFGIVEQTKESNRLRVPSGDNMRYLGINPEESRGCCWARALCMSLYRDEDYFFQIDSHMIFDYGWDERMIEAAEECAAINPRFVISDYPHPFKIVDDKFIKEPVTNGAVCAYIKEDQKFNDDSPFVNITGLPVDTDTPLKGFHIAAGCVFADGNFVNEIPYDPLFYFQGEEQSVSIRAYTHGWDIFHIPRLPIYHLYDNNDGTRAKHWSEEEDKVRSVRWWELDRQSKERFNDLIHGNMRGIYGLGTDRTLEQFVEFSGVDYRNKVVYDKATKGCWNG